MVKIIEQDDTLVLSISKIKKVAALHRHLVANKSDLISRKIVENPWRSGLLKGIRAPGTAIPYRLLLGTMRYRGGKDFTIIYRNHQVEVFEFRSGPFERWIISKEK